MGLVLLFGGKFFKMLEIQKVRENPEIVVKGLEKRHFRDAAARVEEILSLDEQRRKAIAAVEGLRNENNVLAKSIGELMKSGKKDEAESARARSIELKEQTKELETQLADLEARQDAIMVTLPNLPHSSTPEGRTPEDNVVAHQNDVVIQFDFTPKPHWELALAHGIIDWELGAKITGAGFPVYRGKGAQLQRALISFFLDRARDAGYLEIQPPYLINADSGYGTGQLPDKDGQMYEATRDGLYLIPTAEVPITNLYRNVILDEAELPIRNCGYSACFRREAGSYGKDVKGLNRLHQFDKVEVVELVKPEDSYETLERMVRYSESLIEALGLPYRRLALCAGDLGFTSAKTYDLEVFSAGQDRWLEVSSVSNFETFQTNRLKVRYRDAQKRTRPLHSLNGSALALPRIVAALLECYQQADGSILVPEVLRPYTRFDRIGG